MNKDRTGYETAPVANIVEAIEAMINAYNELHEVMRTCGPAEDLRTLMLGPVSLPEQEGLHMSLYEIGIAAESAPTGRLSVNREKLTHALQDRPETIKAFFITRHTGVLMRVMLFIQNYFAIYPLSLGTDELLHPLLLRFFNECRRLHAFWR